MNGLSHEQLKKVVFQSLEEIHQRFANDPRPADGSFRAEREAMLRFREPRCDRQDARECPPIPPAQQAELDRRLATQDADVKDARPAKDVLAELRNRYR